MRFGPVPLDEAEGTILAHSLRLPGLILKKSRRLSAADVAALRERGIGQVTAIAFEPGDVPEDEAAARLAAVMDGPHLRVAEAFTGRANIFAEVRGLLLVDEEAVRRINERDEAVTVATLPAFAAVEPGQMVATVKIIPFAAPEAALEDCVALARETELVRMAPYVPHRVRMIQTVLPGTAEKMLDKTVRVTRGRVESVGGTLVGESRCAHEVEALAREIRQAAAEPFEMLLIAGASAITDRRDVLPAAIEAAGGRIDHFGMPVDPGNLLLLARLGLRRVLGLPGCCRSPRINGFDWVLQRLAAGLEVGRHELASMGVGGLLMEIPSRPQPREAAPGERAEPRVAALVLAAGQSRRMGARNKLLVEVAGKPMVRHMVEAALASRAGTVVVVTGHEAERLRAALDGLDVRFVHNGHYAEGLSTSLRAGLAALPGDTDGALVCLADMPLLTAAHLDRLIDAFDPAAGRSVVVPTRGGKRGNPVLWGRIHFAAMHRLEGDVGARHLIGEHAGQVAEVAMEDGASLLDIDTPEALAAFEGDAS
ncbi:molybdopterin-binding/glycosyltransferase family 2 protein [Geminicoccaceae bacterium 1502E]|nr:molybdopterin-binding/glycosyltransferase family 2 protein [Geminicoccaceae bacterium 1502E]